MHFNLCLEARVSDPVFKIRSDPDLVLKIWSEPFFEKWYKNSSCIPIKVILHFNLCLEARAADTGFKLRSNPDPIFEIWS